MSTKISPFYANYGYHPSFNLTPRANSVVQASNDFAKALYALHAELKLTLESSIRIYKEYADRKRREGPSYEIDDWVMLNASNIALKVPCRKLGPKRIGPLKVVAKIGTSAYRL